MKTTNMMHKITRTEYSDHGLASQIKTRTGHVLHACYAATLRMRAQGRSALNAGQHTEYLHQSCILHSSSHQQKTTK